MKIILLWLIVLAVQILPQGYGVYGQGNPVTSGYFLWNAVTGTNLVTDTDVFLYGSFTKTKVPKDSTGSKTASKYMTVYKLFSSYTSDWSADADGWLLDPETPITTYNVDGVWGVDNCAYVPTNMSIIDTLFYENLPFEGFIRIQFDYYYGMFGTTILIRGIGNEAFNHNIQPESYMSWNHFDSTFAVSSNIYGVDAISGLNITSSGDSLYLKDFSYDFYYGDSTRTLSKSVSLDDLIEDETYTYYCSVLQPNGRYSKGDDSTFTTPINAPDDLHIQQETSLIAQATITWADNSSVEDGYIIERKLTNEGIVEFTAIDTINDYHYTNTGLVDGGDFTYRVRAYRNDHYSNYSDTLAVTITALDLTPTLDFVSDTLEILIGVSNIHPLSEQIVLYKNSVNIDSVDYIEGKITFSDSGITDTSWYKVRVYGQSTSALTDSYYVAPIIPAMPNPTPLTAQSDTTGVKLAWQDNSSQEDGFIIKRSLVVEPLSFTALDTVGANITEYCDSIPTITENTSFVYEVDAYKGAFTFESNVDTVLCIYYIADSSYASADTILVVNPYTYPDSVNYMVIDTTAGSGKTIPVIESQTSHTNGLTAGAVTSTLVLDRPTGIEADDLMLIMVMTENDTSGATPQYTMQNDWTYLGESGDATQAVRIGAFYKISDGTEDATDTLTVNMGNTNTVGFWLRVSNVNTVDPINTSNFTLSSGNATAHIVPALTTDEDTCLAIAGLSFDGADYGATLTNGFAWRTKQDTVSAFYGSGVGVTGIWGSKSVLSAGTTTADTITFGTSDGAAYFMIALNGAGSGNVIDTTFYYADTTWNYTLLAFNCAEGEEPSPPNQVTGLDTVSANSTQINLIWNDLDNETGYRIEYVVKTEAESQFLIADYNTADDTTYTITGLFAETEYYVRVLAYNLNGNGEYSDTIVTITRATPPIVEGTIIEADYYFDAENGNDSNDGLTPATAKRGTTGFNNLNLTAGTIVAFRDSMTYRASTSSALGGFYIESTENGTPTNPITITNWYGASSDSFPVFDGSLLITNTWTNTSGNIWQTTVPRAFSGYVRAVWFTMEASPDSMRWGSVRQGGTGYMVKEFDCYGASGSTTLYIYSPSNPNTRYKKVEYMPYAGSTSSTVQTMCVRGDYINFQYLDFTKANYDGMYITSYSTGVNVYDCNFYYNGASWYFDTGNIVGGDNGNGVEIHGNYSTFKRCLFMENGSHGYSIYGNGGNIPTRNTVDSSLFINNHHTVMVDINNQSESAYQNGVDTVIIRWNRSYVTNYFPYDQDNPEIHPANMWMSRDNNSQAGLTNNIIFANNLVYGGDPCINAEASVDDFWIYNNTFIHPDPSMSYVWYGTQASDDMHFFNNIAVSFYTYPAIARNIIAPTNPPEGNVVWMVNAANGWYGGVVPPNNYTDTNPLFNGFTASTVIQKPSDIDFNSYIDERFTLQATSPAIGYGINAKTLWDSENGWQYDKSLNGITRTTTWDAGCYQYVP